MKILVIGPSWVGDTMMSQSMYRLLVQRYPKIHIDVIAPTWCSSLLNCMPEVNEVITVPFSHGILALSERYHLGQLLRRKKYQQAIVLPNSFKSALVPFFANISHRTGWCGEMRYGLLNDIRTLNKQKFPLMVQRYAALAFDCHIVKSAVDLPELLPWPSLKIDVQKILEAKKIFFPDTNRQIIGFCPGAEFNLAKRWPHYHYATLAKQLIHRGYQVVLFGSAKDYEICTIIYTTLLISERRYCQNMAGKTTLEQVVTLIAACQGIVSNDSGLMHIASALNCPLIALYGPSDPNFTPPLSHQAKVIHVINGYKKIQKKNSTQNYHKSLISIQPSHVLNELEKIFSLKRTN